jgi:hypothetical protein
MAVLALTAAGAVPSLSAARAVAESDDREATFSALMEGATLEGQFDIVGPQGVMPAQSDVYSVSKLERADDGRWVFHYQMGYTQNAPMAPIPVTVEWAGETPVITVTDQALPGVPGTFSARVLIHAGKYAGTWSHGPIGGHMWGVVKKPAPSP